MFQVMWVKQLNHPPVITISIGGMYKPFPNGWFMALLYHVLPTL
jgi:hypothetical protein